MSALSDLRLILVIAAVGFGISIFERAVGFSHAGRLVTYGNAIASFNTYLKATRDVSYRVLS